ncbi:MAG: hypothetical protein FD144_2639 [Rhodospirillaceae bacterium]|nr:MAG: hypothetical protein FD144_2639 [Rhodospirillaceae bacterium]
MTAIYLRFHAWRAFHLQADEPELFHVVIPMGFVSLCICRICLIDVRRKLRRTIEEAVSKSEAATTRGHGWTSDNAGLHPDDREGR